MPLSTTPTEVLIKTRKAEFDFSLVPRIWLCDLPTTHFLNALSIFIPFAERIVIQILRTEVRNIEDEKLKQEVAGLIKQEALHAKVHHESNQALIDAGYPAIKHFVQWQQFLMGMLTKFIPRLSIPAAFEHFTSAIAKSFLSKMDDWTGGKSNPAINFVFWHAFEELEHQSVCIDLYRDKIKDSSAATSWVLPLLLMLFWLPLTVVSIYGVQTYMLIKDKAWRQKGIWKMWWRCISLTVPVLYRGIWRYRNLNSSLWSESDISLYLRHLDSVEVWSDDKNRSLSPV